LRQLTALDQQFLALEDSRHVGHVGELAVLDPSTAPGGTVTVEDLQLLIADRLPLVPPFRWRLATVPFDLDYGYWLDDADFDLDFGRISAHRRFAFGCLSLDEVKDVKNSYGCTVNDVIVSICAGAVRRWLLEHRELPDDPLVAQIPVSVRTELQQGTYGNRILLMTAPLYTNEADPIRRLRATREALSQMKERYRALPAELLQDANQFIPPAMFSRAARLTFVIGSSGRGRPAWNLVVSNVPGPQFPLYMAGARVEANYPISVITDGMGLNITVMSYCGRLDFGIVADREQVPDLWALIGWLGEALEELKPAGRARSRSAQANGGDRKKSSVTEREPGSRQGG